MRYVSSRTDFSSGSMLLCKLGVAILVNVFIASCSARFNNPVRTSTDATSSSSSTSSSGISCPTSTVTGTVSALYPTNGANWNDYVDWPSSATDAYSQSDVTCPATGNGYYSCIHGGEKRKVAVTGQTSCTGLVASDALSVFDWTCKVSGGVATFYSMGFKQSKGLRDLIDFAVPDFYSNSVTVTKTGCSTTVLTTSSTKWWTNAFSSPVFVNTTSPTLNTSGTIYISNADSSTRQITISADKVALVTSAGTSLTYGHSGATQGRLIYPNSSCTKFAWIEGTYFGGTLGRRLIDTSSATNTFCYSRVHRVDYRNFTTVGLGALYFASGNSSNLVSDSVISHGATNTNGAIQFVGASHYNTVNHVRVIDTDSPGIYASGGSVMQTGNIFHDVLIANTGTRGIQITSGAAAGANQNFIVSRVTTINTGSDGINSNLAVGGTSNNNHDFHHISVINANGTGFLIDTGGNNQNVWDVAVLNSSGNNFATNTDNNTYIENLVSLHSGSNNFSISNANTVSVRGTIKLGNATTADCAVSGNTAVELNATCNYGSGLSQTATTGLSGSGVWLDQVTTDDSQNGSDLNGVQAVGTITDWRNFENFWRGWGIYAASFPLSGARGRCTAGNCQIFDSRLRSSDSLLRNANGIFVNGAACPASIDASNSSNVMTDNVSRTFLKHAFEIIGDGFGNENGLCESNESCIYAPNIGAYQGEGDYTSQTCTYTGGNGVTNVTMYAYPTNGN